jgi:cell division protein FtsW
MKTATTFLLFSVLGLLVLGIVILVSASTGQPQARYLVMQPIWAFIGLAACAAAAWLDYRWFKRVWWILLIVSVALLCLVWEPHVGVKANGARRWVNFGGFGFQPSEVAKIALILCLAWYGERYQRFMGTFWRGLVIPGLGSAVILGLIFKEPDVGTTVLLAAVTGTMLVIAGLKFRYVVAPMISGVIALMIFIAHDPMRSERIYAWLHPEETKLEKGMQAWQAMAALGNGGVDGIGLGEGRQKFFLPEHHTDFIFAIIGEELGLVATVGVLFAFLVILICGVYIAWNAADTFGMLIAAGITFLIAMQVTINIGVVSGALPNKGLALPFISYGGSNLVVMLASIGLLISIGRHAGAAANAGLPVGDMEEALGAPAA